jgi:hypothetical protein
MATFTWINKQGVQSSSGFVVQRTGRFTTEYREAGKTLVVEVESALVGNRSVIYYARSAFNSWSTDAAEQERVAANFRSALEFKGLVPQVG